MHNITQRSSSRRQKCEGIHVTPLRGSDVVGENPSSISSRWQNWWWQALICRHPEQVGAFRGRVKTEAAASGYPLHCK
jgi:hypothetical protein